MSPDVTVTAVIRTYERPKLVRRAISSVLNQTYDDYEIVIVDDHSKDETPEVLAEFESEHDSIRVIRHEKNRGPGAAFNTANRAARGEFIAYLDDDDEWTRKKLEVQVEKFQELGKEYGLVTGGVEKIDLASNEVIGTSIPEFEGNIFWDLLREGSGKLLGPPSVVMLRSSAVRAIGEFREDMPRGCGQEYFRRLAKEYKISYVEDICLKYYEHSDRITPHNSRTDIENDIKSREIKLEEFGDDFSQVPKAYARELEKLGNLYCVSGDTSKGREYYVEASRNVGFHSALLFRVCLSYFGGRFYRLFYNPGFRPLPYLRKVRYGLRQYIG